MQIAEAVFGLVPGQGPRTVLLPGSGPDDAAEWAEQGYTAVRLDIEPRNNPDIVASMTEMGEIGPFDAIYCSHALEHLYPHEVNQALREFRRVLKPGGVAIVVVPDLEDVRPTEEKLNFPGEHGICGLHLYYGDFRQIPEFPYMAHHSGFIAETLQHAFEGAGFENVRTNRMEYYNLMAIGVR